MARRNNQATTTDTIAHVAEYLRPVSGIIRNLATVLQILGVAIKDHTLELVLLLRREGGDGCSDEGGALAIFFDVSIWNDLGAMGTTHEYPAATTAASGHCVAASSNMAAASRLAAAVVPSGWRFPAMEAV